jgi:hypothetical protein
MTSVSGNNLRRLLKFFPTFRKTLYSCCVVGLMVLGREVLGSPYIGLA